jgi:hypothetical protein
MAAPAFGTKENRVILTSNYGLAKMISSDDDDDEVSDVWVDEI